MSTINTSTTSNNSNNSSIIQRTSLYVGDLAPEVSENQLFDLFKIVGPVASIRVCRDAVTRRSLGYAYVNFHTAIDAERAMHQFNYQLILNKPCRIMWSQRDPARRKSGTGNIFIKNLDKSINNSALYDTFSAFGHILSCKVELDENGLSKGYGYVHYERQEDADQAVAKVNGMMIASKIVFVGPFQPRKERGVDVSSHFTNVYFKNLDSSVTKQQLEEMFGSYGKVTSCAIMQNENSESRGFGFVNFEKHEEAEAAVEHLNKKLVNGKEMYVGRAQKRHERDDLLRQKRDEQIHKIQGANVYVKNLDDTVDDEKLNKEFSRFGDVTSAKIMTDDKNNSKGFGFIMFAKAEDAARAVAEMNGVIFGSKPLYAGLAQRKEARQAQLAVMHQQRMNMMHMNPMGMMNTRGPGMFPPQGYGMGIPMGMQPRMGQPYAAQMIPRPRAFAPGQPMPNGQPPHLGGQVPFGRGGVPMQPNGAPFQNGTNVGQRMAARPRNPRPPPVAHSAMNGNGKGRAPNAQGQINKGFKYTSTARNQPDEAVSAATAVSAPAPASGPASVPAAMDIEAQKKAAGELLFPLILNKSQPTLAGKITGMLLEAHEVSELFEIARTPARLDSLIGEAMAVLEVA